MTAVQVSAQPPTGAGSQSMRRGWVFAAVWLVYLGYPLVAAWREPNPALRWLGTTALLAFAVLYVLCFVHIRRVRRTGRSVPPLVCWSTLAGLTAVLALAAPAADEQTLGCTIYIAVLAVLALPTRQAWAVVAVLVVAVELLQRTISGWSTDTLFAFQLVLSAFAAWGVSQIIDRNAALAAAQAELADLAVLRERERMARDVHDLLGHSLTVITVKAELAGRLLDAVATTAELDRNAVRARAEIEDIEGQARDALADVRATVSGYRQVTLTGELASARAALAAAGIRAILPTAVDSVPGRFRELYGWAVREGVTNVVRHSQATTCTILVGPDSIEVHDDGSGPDAPLARRAPTGEVQDVDDGHGLQGLRERAAEGGARLMVGRSDRGGFRLQIVADDPAVRSGPRGADEDPAVGPVADPSEPVADPGAVAPNAAHGADDGISTVRASRATP